MWIIGAIPAPAAETLAARLSEARAGEPHLTELADLTTRWQNGEDLPPERLMTLVDLANPGTETLEAIWDDCLDLIGTAPDEARFVSSARKASPIVALCHALGPARMALLPGILGDFVLRERDVTDALNRARRALTGDLRAETVHRLRTWMDEVGDAPDFAAEPLLTAPLRILAHAAATGHGAAAFTRWY